MGASGETYDLHQPYGLRCSLFFPFTRWFKSLNWYLGTIHYFRFRHLLDLYQEQPALLDPLLEDVIYKLLAYIKWLENGQTRFLSSY